MLPCAIRRRSASGVMSTSSICSAARTIASGTVSRCGTPVIACTTSLSDSRCWTLTVEMTSMPASSSSLDLLPAFGVATARHVRVRQLVDKRDLRAARQHGSHVHLLESGAPVGHPQTGQYLQRPDPFGRVHPAVRLDERHHHVGAAGEPPVALVEHPEGLAHPGSGSEIHPELSSLPH